MNRETLEMSSPSLHYAVAMCEANPDYRAAVVVKTAEEAAQARDIITDCLDITQYVISGEQSLVMWKNGSSIRLVFPDDTTRHYHFTSMLFSPSLDDKERKRARCRWLR